MPRPLQSLSHGRLAFIVASLSAIGPFAIDTYLPAFDDIGRGLGASPLQVQQTLSVYMLFLGLMNLWHGALADALGRRRVLLVTLLAFSLASIGAACAGSIAQLWFWRAVQGAAGGAGMTVGRAVVRDVVSGHVAQRILARIMMAFSLAPAIAPVIGGWLTGWFGWRGVFAFLAIVSLAQAALVAWGLPETLPPERRQSLRPRALLAGYRELLALPAFWRISGALTFCFLGFFIYVLGAPAFVPGVLGLGTHDFVWLFGPATAGTLCGGFLASRLAGRRPLGWTLRLGFGVMGLAAALNAALSLGWPGRLPWAVLPVFVYTTGLGACMSALQVMLMDLLPQRSGLVSSVQSFVQSAANGLAAALAVPLVWHSAPSMAAAMAAALALGLACCVAERRARRHATLAGAPAD